MPPDAAQVQSRLEKRSSFHAAFPESIQSPGRIGVCRPRYYDAGMNRRKPQRNS
jgi:hypothetical protein